MVVRDTEHPITKGLPKSFLHAKDELYEKLRGPALNMNILSTAFASKKHRGSGRHDGQGHDRNPGRLPKRRQIGIAKI